MSTTKNVSTVSKFTLKIHGDEQSVWATEAKAREALVEAAEEIGDYTFAEESFIDLAKDADGPLSFTLQGVKYEIIEEKADDENEEAAIALAIYLDEAVSEIVESTYAGNSFEVGGGEYLVLTNEEADASCNEQIKQSLWAFNSSFVANYCCLSADQIDACRGDMCEDFNDTVESLVCDRLDEMIQDAKDLDGRGHFLATFDNEENESDCGKFYIYRTN